MVKPKTFERHTGERIPLKRDLKFVFANTIILAILMSAVSLAGILFPEMVYTGTDTTILFVPNDFLNIFLGVPVLLVSLILAARQNLMGLLCLPGALFYVTYIYATYLLGVPFGILFIPYLILVALSIYSIVGWMAVTDLEAVKNMMEGQVPLRSAGIILFAIACLLVAYQLTSIVRTLIRQSETDQFMIAQWIVDLVIASPPVGIIGFAMIRKKALGYAAGAGLLLVICILFVGLVPVMIIEGKMTGTPVNGMDFLIIIISSLVCLIPFALFVKRIVKV